MSARGLALKSKELIRVSYEILEQIQPASVRSVCYQIFNRNIIRGMITGGHKRFRACLSMHVKTKLSHGNGSLTKRGRRNGCPHGRALPTMARQSYGAIEKTFGSIKRIKSKSCLKRERFAASYPRSLMNSQSPFLSNTGSTPRPRLETSQSRPAKAGVH